MQDVSDKLLQQFVACIEGQFAAAEPGASTDQEPPPDAVAGPNAPPVAAAATNGAAGSAPAVAPAAENAGAAAASPAPRPLRPAPPVDDSIDLGATVLPVLVKSYAPYGVAALVGLLLGWLLGRRRS